MSGSSARTNHRPRRRFAPDRAYQSSASTAASENETVPSAVADGSELTGNRAVHRCVIIDSKDEEFPMIPRSHLLQTEFSSRDCKFTFGIGMLMLIMGLGMMGNNWSRDTHAPLAILNGLFLLCLAMLRVFKTP